MTLNPKFKKRYPKHQGKVEIQPYSGYFWARKKEKKKEEQKKKKKNTWYALENMAKNRFKPV